MIVTMLTYGFLSQHNSLTKSKNMYNLHTYF